MLEGNLNLHQKMKNTRNVKYLGKYKKYIFSFLSSLKDNQCKNNMLKGLSICRSKIFYKNREKWK